MELIKRVFLACIATSLISLLVVALGPDEGLEALGGVLIAYGSLLFHIPAGLVIAVQAYRIRCFNPIVAGILVYFVVIYAGGVYVWGVTSGVDRKVEDFVDSHVDPAGFELRELGKSLHIRQMRGLPLDPGELDRVKVMLDAVENIDASEQAHHPIIWYAAAIGELDLVNAIIDRGATLDEPALFEVSPLYVAVRHGHTSVVEKLIEAGADPDAVDAKKRPALMVASEKGDLAMVDALIEGGASVNLGNHEGAALTTALRSGNVEIVRRLLEAGAEMTPVLGLHPASWAQRQDDPALLRLLATKTDVLSVRVGENDPPAFAALANCEMDTFFDLVKLGTSPNAINKRGESLALYLLKYTFERCPEIKARRAELISRFIDLGLDLRATDERGKPLVLVALNHGRVESARQLVAAGAPFDGFYGKKNLLILAAGVGANDLIDVALAHGMDINFVSDGLNTDSALYEAAREGQLESVLHLLSRGAAMPDTAIGLRRMYFAAGSHPHVFRYLLERYLAGGRSKEHDQMIRRGARDSKNQASQAMLDAAGIP